MKEIKMDDMSVEDILYLFDIYSSEWRHRRQELWSQIFKYFYATIIVLFLPNISSFIGVDLSMFPAIFFPFLGLILSFAFLYVSFSFAVRIEVLKMTCLNLIHLLPESIQRKTIKDSNKWYSGLFGKSSAFIHTLMMFIGLITMSIIMIIYNYSITK